MDLTSTHLNPVTSPVQAPRPAPAAQPMPAMPQTLQGATPPQPMAAMPKVDFANMSYAEKAAHLAEILGA